MAGKHWSKEELDNLREMYESDGLCCSEIAKKIDRSKNSIKVKITRLGLLHSKKQEKSCRSRVNLGEKILCSALRLGRRVGLDIIVKF